MKIDQDTVVTLAYELLVYGADDTTNSLEKRDRQNPVEFIYGLGQLLPAVEKAILGQTVGHKKSLMLFPHDAYGEWLPQLEQTIELSKFPKNLDLKVGMKFQTQGPDNDVISVIVKQIKDGKVLVDGNHPLAGLKIQFDLEILRVREATDDELATGEIHKRLH